MIINYRSVSKQVDYVERIAVECILIIFIFIIIISISIINNIIRIVNITTEKEFDKHKSQLIGVNV